MKTSNTLLFLSARGRLSIGRFWFYWLLILLAQFGFIFLTAVQGNEDEGERVTIFLVLTGLMYLQIIKRMHDVGRSGWYSLVPIYNLMLALTRGDEGANEYGPDPKGESDDLMVNSGILDQQIHNDIVIDNVYSMESELKNFLLYTIVSRLSFLCINWWLSYSVTRGYGDVTSDYSTYQLLSIVVGIIFNVWLLILLGRSINRWLQLMYFFMLIHSALFEIVKMMI